MVIIVGNQPMVLSSAVTKREQKTSVLPHWGFVVVEPCEFSTSHCLPARQSNQCVSQVRTGHPIQQSAKLKAVVAWIEISAYFCNLYPLWSGINICRCESCRQGIGTGDVMKDVPLLFCFTNYVRVSPGIFHSDFWRRKEPHQANFAASFIYFKSAAQPLYSLSISFADGRKFRISI